MTYLISSIGAVDKRLMEMNTCIIEGTEILTYNIFVDEIFHSWIFSRYIHTIRGYLHESYFVSLLIVHSLDFYLFTNSVKYIIKNLYK